MQTTAVALVIISAVAAPTLGDIVVDHSPPRTDNVSFYSNAAPNAFTTQNVYDDFTLGAGIDLSQITVWGFYDAGFPAIPSFRVRIFAGTASTIGLLAFDQTLTAVATPTGLFQGSFQIIRYDIAITPQQIAAGTYWLSVGNSIPTARWGWTPQNTPLVPGMQIALEDAQVNPAWHTIGDYDRAFQIIPSPGAATLVALGLAGFRRRRK
ncbi:MAG: hypothetical protein ACREJO_00310 [Phycisphaerales bacterium]